MRKFGSIGTAIMIYPDGTLRAQIQPSDAAEIVFRLPASETDRAEQCDQ